VDRDTALNGSLSFLYAFFVEKLPYVTIAVFLAGTLIRLNRWLSAPKDPKGPRIDPVVSLKYIILDVVLFRKTYKTDKLIWLTLVLFHVGVGGILFGHMRGFHWWSAAMFEPLGHWVAEFMVHTLPIYIGWMFIATQIILLVRRGNLEKKQLLSLPNDYGALILLLITSILGQGMRIVPPEAIPTEIYNVVFIPGLIVLHLEKVPSFHWFFWHVLFTQLLVMYIPFSKLVHVITGVITPALYGSRRQEYGV
jgi:nitrate reductase gamma subunit